MPLKGKGERGKGKGGGGLFKIQIESKNPLQGIEESIYDRIEESPMRNLSTIESYNPLRIIKESKKHFAKKEDFTQSRKMAIKWGAHPPFEKEGPQQN